MVEIDSILLVELTRPNLTDSCRLPKPFHGDPADQIIVATARGQAGILYVAVDDSEVVVRKADERHQLKNILRTVPVGEFHGNHLRSISGGGRHHDVECG